MLVVKKKLKLSDQCYCISVDLLDTVISVTQEKIVPEDVHLLSVCCLILASKYEEITFIGIDFANKGICHEKYTREQIKGTEMFILQSLKFRMRRNFFEDFATLIVDEVVKPSSTSTSATSYARHSDPQVSLIRDRGPMQRLNPCAKRKSQSEKKVTWNKRPVVETMVKASNFVYKLVVQDYNLFRKCDKLTLYFAVLYFCLDNGLKNDRFKVPFRSFKFFEIADHFKLKMKDIVNFSEKIKENFGDLLKSHKESEYLYKIEYYSLNTC